MMKRFALLLAALLVASMVLVAPVIASGNDDNHNNKVCVLRPHNDGKDYRWVWDVEDLHVGDKVVKDHFCEHKDNNGDDNGHADNMNAHS